MPAATALSVRDLAYWYVAGARVLDGAVLTVAPGEVVMVRGPNGSGKTTLLRLAAGVAAPRRGVVRQAAAVGYQPQTGEAPHWPGPGDPASRSSRLPGNRRPAPAVSRAE